VLGDRPFFSPNPISKFYVNDRGNCSIKTIVHVCTANEYLWPVCNPVENFFSLRALTRSRKNLEMGFGGKTGRSPSTSLDSLESSSREKTWNTKARTLKNDLMYNLKIYNSIFTETSIIGKFLSFPVENACPIFLRSNSARRSTSASRVSLMCKQTNTSEVPHKRRARALCTGGFLLSSVHKNNN